MEEKQNKPRKDFKSKGKFGGKKFGGKKFCEKKFGGRVVKGYAARMAREYARFKR